MSTSNQTYTAVLIDPTIEAPVRFDDPELVKILTPLMGVHLPLWLGCLVLYFIKRNHYNIRNHGFVLAFTGSALGFCATIVLYLTIMSTRFICAITAWSINVLFTTSILTECFRFIELYHKFKLGEQHFLGQHSNFVQLTMSETSGRRTSETAESPRFERQDLIPAKKPIRVLAIFGRLSGRQWYGLTCCAVVISMIIVQVVYISDLSIFPMMASLVILRDVGSLNGTRAEMVVLSIINPIIFVIWCLGNSLFMTGGVSEWKEFSSMIWFLVTLTAQHCCSVVVPLAIAFRQDYRARRLGNLEYNMRSFHKVLKDKKLMTTFTQLCVNDLSFENPMFYLACQRLTREIATARARSSRPMSVISQMSTNALMSVSCSKEFTMMSSSHSLSISLLPKRVQELMWEIYRKFIISGAEFEINLNHEQRNEIMTKFEAGDIPSDVFVPAERTIVELMYLNTFPAFLELGQRIYEDQPNEA
ncbi:uncharacterized protein BJ171DRAFT_599906 [Polychytrium aggregatum]|uniref:uncharacterized protein n=1 Tax=Polychytrium aggregatum TaxID=110093 RepID=UPI0022FE7443|nr:uncharacterized protein BJ171DRAFT_599906 [Polychytrium aggregatum]KAI9203675.1 hypothetical protein BJ171DRAFT_599906 [Polychytrium aggregatum]